VITDFMLDLPFSLIVMLLNKLPDVVPILEFGDGLNRFLVDVDLLIPVASMRVAMTILVSGLQAFLVRRAIKIFWK
jgi:hypothetical protein